MDVLTNVHAVSVTSVGSASKTQHALDLLFEYQKREEKIEIMVFDISPQKEIPSDLLDYEQKPFFKSVPSLADVLVHVEEIQPSGIVINNIHFACKKENSYQKVMRQLYAIAEKLDAFGFLRANFSLMIITGREETEDAHNNEATQAVIGFCGKRITLGSDFPRTFLVPEEFKIPKK